MRNIEFINKNCYDYYKKFNLEEDIISYDVKLQYFVSTQERKIAFDSGEDNINVNKTVKYYMAPEILKNLDTKEDDPIAAYIWSLDIITYNLLTGQDTPFQGNNDKEVPKNIEKNKIKISKKLCPSLEIIRFITNLLKYSPTERPNLKKIKEFEF